MLSDLLAHVGSAAQGCLPPRPDISDEAERVGRRLAELRTAAAAAAAAGSGPGGSAAGRFEWVDGALCQAVERGQWVLLDNANLCNPTVLDRLNSLLEPGGVLLLNERGAVDGKPRVITPHPDFRLFLALDPR